MNFIEWCNNNIGFASILLSALTLLVSIIAVVVSIQIHINAVFDNLSPILPKEAVREGVFCILSSFDNIRGGKVDCTTPDVFL